MSDKKNIENKLWDILSHSLDVICTIDEDNRFVTVSSASEKVWGYRPEEISGEKYLNFVHPDDIELTREMAEKVMNGNDVPDFQNRCIRKDGSVVQIVWSAKWDDDDKLMYCVAKDATKLNITRLEMELLINNTEESFILVNRELNIISFNKQFAFQYEEFYGKKVTKGASILDYTLPGRREKVEAIFKNVLEGEKVKSELTVSLPGDQLKTMAINYKPAINEYSEIIGVFVTALDITEEMEARRLLEQSNERYELVTQATSDAIWDFVPATGKLYWGEGFKTLFGYERRENGNNIDRWMGNIHPDDIDIVKRKVDELMTGPVSEWDEEYRFKKSDGIYAFIRDKALVIRDDSGRPLRIIGAMEDITEKKREEQWLKLMESAVANAGDSVLITKAEPDEQCKGLEIVYVNEAFERMTGYKAEEIIGKTPDILQGPNTDREAIKMLGEKIRKWEPAETEIINYKKNGEEFWVNFSVNPLANDKGWYTHWIAIERDVTDRKNRELRQEIISNISQIFNDSKGLRESLKASLSILKNLGDFKLAEIWLVSHDRKAINLGASIDDVKEFYNADNGIRSLKPGEGLPGKIWETGEEIFWPNLQAREEFARSTAAKKSALNTA